MKQTDYNKLLTAWRQKILVTIKEYDRKANEFPLGSRRYSRFISQRDGLMMALSMFNKEERKYKDNKTIN